MMKNKLERLAERLAKNKALLQKKQLALERATSNLASLRRRQRTWLLTQYGALFEQAGLVDLERGETAFERDVVLGFLCTLKNCGLPVEEMERYREIGKKRGSESGDKHRPNQ